LEALRLNWEEEEAGELKRKKYHKWQKELEKSRLLEIDAADKEVDRVRSQ